MNRNTLITTLIILALVVVGIVLFTSTSTTQTNQPQTNQPTEATTTEGTDQDDGRRITAKHQYNSEDSMHIVAGEVDVPTPCHQLTTSVDGTATSSSVTINFQAQRADEGEMCAQVITPRRFKVTFEAREDVEIQATYDGNPATLNLVPVPEGENLEEFEVFQKG